MPEPGAVLQGSAVRRFFSNGWDLFRFTIPVLIVAALHFCMFVNNEVLRGQTGWIIILFPMILPAFILIFVPQIVGIFPLLAARSFAPWLLGFCIFTAVNIGWWAFLSEAYVDSGSRIWIGEAGTYPRSLSLCFAIGMFASSQIGAMILSQRAYKRRRLSN